MVPTTLNDRRRCVGFTLVELLLAVALLLLLIGAVVFSFSNLQEGAVLEEGANQLEALFRFARAQACASGRQVQINFEEDVGGGVNVPLGRLQVLWEPDPVAHPGEFEPLREATAYVDGLVDRISIEEVHPWPRPALAMNPATETTDTAAFSSSSTGTPAATGDAPSANGPSDFGFAPVMFYPDGSGDSVELIVAGRDALEHRLLALSYSSVACTFRRRYLPREDAGLSPLPEEESKATSAGPEAVPLP